MFAAGQDRGAVGARACDIAEHAVDPEATRLAALCASEEDIRQLESFARAHCAEPTEDGRRVEQAVCFHCQLVRSSHHKLMIEIGLLADTVAYIDRINEKP